MGTLLLLIRSPTRFGDLKEATLYELSQLLFVERSGGYRDKLHAPIPAFVACLGAIAWLGFVVSRYRSVIMLSVHEFSQPRFVNDGF